ncbi:hypothetical protein BAUCODRAFT_125827 [Baudoinia panamericana UAMH 10762]|uniref:Uncharacterized protein n=1 Tax=Baudoinia panamericana (strain UAMH 10762) TaxID=717646 RepID=M2MN45_BAUPA|nr:uncharacterized protein BAUCODRAFT_125827 [Baudoinia panamericana UAMH 10762]EMC92868.1 hypothetical protein BAUCODRAFT_125827 [Baudoinia panamericana UAMH 10762]
MPAKETSLYGIEKQRKLAGGKEISSSTSLSFTSQLSSLINSGGSGAKSATGRSKSRKEDIFATHNRNTAKRAKRDLEDSSAVEQKHTPNGEVLDSRLWERSKKKMEEKARLYAAMKRGDVEDADERYAVDFDRKWAETEETGDEELEDGEDDAEEGPQDIVEYLDEFGRTRQGTAAEAARAERAKRDTEQAKNDGFTARPSAPTNVIYGDTIQHQAFDPDAPIAAQMEELARKRDKSLTPPSEEHFDSNREVRTKGTGFFQFSADAEERKRQMENLERERAQTEKVRQEREAKLAERKRQLEARRAAINQRRGKRKADDFLEQLGEELGMRQSREDASTEMTERIEAAVQAEADET